MRENAVNIDYLDEFVYLADSLSFKRTADHFYVSRSVISRHIAALEDMLGIRLVDRDTRSVNLTEAGRVFYREAQTVLRDWNSAVERVRRAGRGSTSIVRIGYLRNAARPVLVPFANFMAMAHPEIRLSFVSMEYAELRRAIAEHSVDVAVAMNVNAAISRNYRSTPIYDDKFAVAVAPNHELAKRRGKLRIQDLRGQRLLIPATYIQAGLGALVDRLVDEDTLASTQTFYQDAMLLALKIMSEGYAAFISTKHIEEFGDDVVALTIDDANTSFSVSAFYHDDFNGDAYHACAEGFERCRAMLAS